MRTIIIRRTALLLIAGCLLPLFGGGCSSGNQGVQPVSARASGRGTVQVKIQWPAVPKGRLVPIACQSIQVNLLQALSSFVSQTVARPTSGTSSTVNFQNVPAGVWDETALAYPTTDATGTPQAEGSQSVTVVADTVTTTPDLVMDSTITLVTVNVPNSAVLVGGSPTTLTSSASDSRGRLVLTAPSNMQWTLQATTVASLTPSGASAALQGLAVGTAMVSVKETESGVSSAVVSIGITTTTTAPPTGTNILITDYGNNRIVGLDAIPPTKTLTYNDSISGKPFTLLVGTAYDSAGRIYIGDNYAGIVRVDDFTGTNRIAYAPSGIAVDAVCVDKAGKIYWVDSNATVNRIDDMTGTNHITFGNRATLGYNLNSLAVDSLNRVYTFGSQVVRITDITNSSTASPNVTVFGGSGTGKNQFSGFGGLAVDSNNKIYIADSGNSRIVRVDDMTGLNWTEFDVPKVSGSPEDPYSVAVDSSATPSIYFLGNASKMFKMTDMTGSGLTGLGAFTNGVSPLNNAAAITVK